MTAEDFAKLLKSEIVEQGTAHYCDLLGLPKGISHEGAYAHAVEHLSSLDRATKSAIKLLLEQVSIDSISHVLGIIDGSTILADHRGEFKLLYEDREPLNGDLQSFFLAEFET